MEGASLLVEAVSRHSRLLPLAEVFVGELYVSQCAAEAHSLGLLEVCDPPSQRLAVETASALLHAPRDAGGS
jgi:hypothetical protein